MNTNQEGISIIVCCYNSEHSIEPTINALNAIVIPDGAHVELLLVNNNCTDQTIIISKKLWENNYPMHIVNEAKPGLYHARQAGLAAAKYSIISFIDDDNHVPVNWVSFLIDKFKDPSIGIIGVKTSLTASFTPPTWFNTFKEAYACADLYKSNWQDVTADALVFGAGMSMRAEIYHKLKEKNWQATLTGRIGTIQAAGDDSEICLATRQLGYKIYYTNQVSIGHAICENRLTEEKLLAMYQGFGVADAGLVAYNYYWLKKNNTMSLVWKLRKFRWFNILGKLISNAKLSLKVRNQNSLKNLEIQTQIVRNKAFIQHLKANPALWELYFSNASKLL
jgi:glycosyltransferase involved in cell wall biosynthesis